MLRLQAIGPSSLPSPPVERPLEASFGGRIPTHSVDRNAVGEQVAAGGHDDVAGLDWFAFHQHGPSHMEDLRPRLQLKIPDLIGCRRASGCLLDDFIGMDAN